MKVLILLSTAFLLNGCDYNDRKLGSEHYDQLVKYYTECNNEILRKSIIVDGQITYSEFYYIKRCAEETKRSKISKIAKKLGELK